MRLSSWLAVSSILSPAWSFDVKGSIALSPVLSSVSDIPINAKVSLDHGARYAYVLEDGSFSFPAVGEGKHVIQALIPGYMAELLLLNINETIHIQPYHPARQALPASVPSRPHPLTITLSAKEDYFTDPPGMNLLAMLKNPMVLMMLFSGLMMFGVPKFMAMMEMDPEMAQVVADTRKRMGGAQNADYVGSLSSVLAGGETDASNIALPDTSRASTPSRSAGGGSGGKKRKGK